jgi:polysaccharide export outer membrane protein
MYLSRLFLLVICSPLLSLLLSGCASYRDLPSGTKQHIGHTSPLDVSRQSVDIYTNDFLAPLPPKSYDYRLGPNDVLYVNVSGKPEFVSSGGGSSQLKGYRVDGRGCIYLPIAGKIMVAGLPLSEARDRITTLMQRYYNEPWVVVEIAEYRNRQVFVFGAVKKQGAQPLPASGMNLLQAIANADVQSVGRSSKQIRIIRSLSPTEGELLVVDIDRMMRGKEVPLPLQEGDIVYLPKSAIGSWNEALSDLLPSLQTVSSALQPFVNIKYLKE